MNNKELILGKTLAGTIYERQKGEEMNVNDNIKNAKKLAELILANPELPVVPIFPGLRMDDDNIGSVACNFEEPYIAEYWKTSWEFYYVYIKENPEDLSLEAMTARWGAVFDFTKGHFPIQIADEQLLKEYEKVPWTKAIILELTV